MINKTLTVAFLAAALVVCGTVAANENSGTAAVTAQANCTASNPIDDAGRSCGRGITQQQAASLWAGYCQEDCEYKGGGCGHCGSRTCGGGCHHGGRLRGRFSAFGSKECGCDNACGEAVTSGCGGGCEQQTRCGKLRGMFHGSGCQSDACGCGCDMGCFGYPTAGGCGCDDGCHSRGIFSGCGSRIHGLFHRSSARCGCNGAYFGESVGYEYGNAGMQSCVSGIAEGVSEPQTEEQAAPVEAPEPVVDDVGN